MNINTAIMLGAFSLLGLFTWFLQGLDGVFQGLKSSLGTLGSVWALLLLALGVAGFLRVLVPQEVVSSYLGPVSGIKGYLIAGEWEPLHREHHLRYTRSPLLSSRLVRVSARS